MTARPHYPSGSLGAALLAHDNDYRLDADLPISDLGLMPRCTVVVPYYEASRTVTACVDHLLAAVANLRNATPDAAVQIIVVDDGSVRAPAAARLQRYVSTGRVQLATSARNGGRASARNIGLEKAEHPIVVFVDADVLVHPQTLVDHLRVHNALGPRSPITVGLFCFCDDSAWPGLATDPNRFDRGSNDFRLDCWYQPSYVGCDDDSAFVGQRFRPLAQTDGLRSWPRTGFLGPWTIANMVLGGLFACNRDLARFCGGFEAINGPYGFVETTLVAKLIAIMGCPVVPLTAKFALHIEDRTVAIPRDQRDQLYQAAHHRFFGAFLHRLVK
jgi:glycosyltransferase involved in cell wall biosynthesis